MADTRTVQPTRNVRGAVLTVRASDTVAQAARIMSGHKVGALVVTDDAGRAVGIVSERDILTDVVAEDLPAGRTPVVEVMTVNLVSCAMATGYAEARRLMAEHGIRHLPILEDGRPVGMLSIRDVLTYELARARRRAAVPPWTDPC